MVKMIGFIFFCLLLGPALVWGQCPEKKWLWDRLHYLRTAREYSPKQIAQELQGYEKNVARCFRAPDSVEAFLFQRLGASGYGSGDYLAAIEYTRKSIEVLRAIPAVTPTTSEMLAKNYSNLVLFYGKVKLTAQRITAMDSCLSVSMKHQLVNEDFLYVLLQRVDYFLNIGDFSNCYSYASTGEEYAGRYPYPERAREYLFSFINYRVNVLLLQSQYDKAAGLLKEKISGFKSEEMQGYLASLYEMQAETEIRQGKFEQARKSFETALQLDLRGNFMLGSIQVLNNLGLYYYSQHLNDCTKALATFRKAVDFSSTAQDEKIAVERLNILANIANVYVKKRLFDSAFYFYKVAFDQIEPGLDENKLVQASTSSLMSGGKLSYLSSLVIDKGDAFYQKFIHEKKKADATEALRIYKVAIRILERLKDNQTALESKLFWRRDSRRLFDHAIDLCYQTSGVADAFYFLEKSRAVLLQDQLSELQNFNASEIAKQNELKGRILQNQWALNDPAMDATKRTAAQKELLAQQVSLQQLTENIKSTRPLYFQNYIDSSFISLADLKRTVLSTHQAFIELFEGEQGVYLFTALRDRFYFKKLDKSEYIQTVALYTNYLTDRTLINRELPSFLRTANRLFNLLFDGVRIPEGRIIVSPDSLYFPFESLVTTVQPQPVYLIEKYAFSYAYSARFLMNDFHLQNKAEKGELLGMAPVRYPAAWNLSELSGSDQSLVRIANSFRNKIVETGVSATRGSFMKGFPGYSIVQLYTHASATSWRHEPVLYFADSALFFSEMMPAFRPLTRLVVLSACESGFGKVNTGEGMFGFNRAFAGIGIPATVSSLWVADNLAIYRLNELFYQQLRKGLPTDVALQEAKKKFIHSTPNKLQRLPYYWAGTVLTGKPEAIEIRERNLWLLWFGAAMLAAITCFLFWRRKNRRQKPTAL